MVMMNLLIKRVILVLVILLTCSWVFGQELNESQKFMEAASKGEMALVKSFLDKGFSTEFKDKVGRTPLHLAAKNGHQATADILLQYGAEINAKDNEGHTPLDLAEAAQHDGLIKYLLGKGAKRAEAPSGLKPDSPRPMKPSLKFKTLEEFAKEIGESAVQYDSQYICFFAPKRREKEAKIVFGYLVKAYTELYQITGTHTDYKVVVYAFPKGNPNGWGGTSECSIEYDDTNLDFSQQPEWTQYKVPHVSGYIEEMAHNFVGATKAQFGWEMIGWSIGMQVSQKVAGNPYLSESLRSTRDEQHKTYNRYIENGLIFPEDLPANQCDRIHAWILYQSSQKYGPSFWKDFFREVRVRQKELKDAVYQGHPDQIRNTRYRITLDCFEALPELHFKDTLRKSGISLTTDIKSLHPETPGWSRKFSD